MIRTDSALIKHLAHTVSLDAALVYNRLPLFVIPEESQELMQHERSLLDAAPDILPLPFDDFLLDFPFGTGPLLSSFGGGGSSDRGRLWVRVRRFEALSEIDRATTVRPDQLTPLRSLRDGIFLEGWEEKTAWGGLPPYPDYSAVDITRARMGDFTSHWHLYPRPECPNGERAFGRNLGWCNLAHCSHKGEERNVLCASSEFFQATMCRLVVLSLIYISEGLGGVTTEASWKPKPGSREEKTERVKPWAAPRRETYIIIDPVRAAEYGHPSGARPETPGHHASPTPHPRRGHWRRIPPDRKTWVRQTWVGAKEWSHEGRTYRIRI